MGVKKERDNVRLYVYECVVCVCFLVCVKKEWGRVCVCVSGCMCVYECVTCCVCVRVFSSLYQEREGNIVCLCVGMYMCMCVYVLYVWGVFVCVGVGVCVVSKGRSQCVFVCPIV